ncbi:hypothetical protein GCM10010344_49690 [Streptomyces bluensis]|nr:hypothetical protein GCM10010344_49690 [Streptomyces bluensis]
MGNWQISATHPMEVREVEQLDHVQHLPISLSNGACGAGVTGKGALPPRRPGVPRPLPRPFTGVRRRTLPACMRDAVAPAASGRQANPRHAPIPLAPRSPGLPARFFPVLERAESRVGRRPIAEGDAERQRSALYSGRGSTTLTKKRAAPTVT